MSLCNNNISDNTISDLLLISGPYVCGWQVLALCNIIAASVTLDDLNNEQNNNLDVFLSLSYPDYDWNWGQIMEASKGICGTLIFLSLLIMIIEGLVIAQRFLNVGLIERHNQAFIIAVSIIIITTYIILYY